MRPIYFFSYVFHVATKSICGIILRLFVAFHA
jgi:hypothetical protein